MTPKKKLKSIKKSKWFTAIVTLCLVSVFLFAAFFGCDESKTSSKSGEINPALLIGEWDCVKFAYIAKDKTISDVALLSKGQLKIPNLEDKWLFTHGNQYLCTYSISDNLISFTAVIPITYAMPFQEEIDISEALENAYSFSIKDNELIFHFAGVENKNLLILKKR